MSIIDTNFSFTFIQVATVDYQLPNLNDSMIMFAVQLVNFPSAKSGPTLWALVGNVKDHSLITEWSEQIAYVTADDSRGYPAGIVGLLPQDKHTAPLIEQWEKQQQPRRFWAFVRKVNDGRRL